ncbi:MAG: hypothetical protein J5648_08525 [Lachnospiraceae bacterium]|nr:hypothetical protein [Lachnospiraceae bacterium]
MFNMIRSDFYRMVRMKSFYIILIIICVMNLASFAASKAVQEDEAYMEYMEKTAAQEEAKGDAGASDIGMSILIQADPDGKFEVYMLIKEFMGGYMGLLFLGIFAVIFASADFNNGYIKNYGGQLRFRTRIMCSKSVCLVAYTAILFILFVFSFLLGVWISGSGVKVSDVGKLVDLLSVQFLLHVAFATVITAICVIVRSNLIAMALCGCIAMNILRVFYGLADKGLKKLGWKKADIAHYTVTGRIAEYASDGKMLCSTIIIAVAFIAAAFLAGGLWLRKKDLV